MTYNTDTLWARQAIFLPHERLSKVILRQINRTKIIANKCKRIITARRNLKVLLKSINTMSFIAVHKNPAVILTTVIVLEE